eukprot:TRINITY_DN6934_c0_g1_i1.p1 TRINITY_DN6934_c0_g1~~TRINITY_DN6934_c0_g1_i1.p1  ORF type:complete len:425 (-),score=29.15 TRINITY_DN6934_c0_g1_i1:102-1328(-)
MGGQGGAPDDDEDDPWARRERERGAGRKKKGKEGRKSGGRLTKVKRPREDRGEQGRYAEGERQWDDGGPHSEDDAEGRRTRADEAFIDDEGVAPDDRMGARYDSDDERRVGSLPQAEEDTDAVGRLFKAGKKRKHEMSDGEKALFVEEFHAKMRRAAEDDADSNRRGRPAIAKLRMLAELMGTLRKKHLQREFLDRGVFSYLKDWLEPLPDLSLPNIKIRTSILELLGELPIDVGNNSERRRQLKESGLGRVVMFLSKLPEETVQNRKLARDLVDTWSRPIFEKSIHYRDLKDDYDRPSRPPPSHRDEPPPRVAQARPVDDLDDAAGDDREEQEIPKAPPTRIPQPMAMDFRIRPESKVTDEWIARRGAKDARHQNVSKKLLNMKRSKNKNLRAEKVSVQGRGLVKLT